MLGNLLNFAFNAVLGRFLTFEQFGQLTLFTTLWAIIGIFLNAFGSTINHRVSYLFSINKARAFHFYNSTFSKGIIVGSLFTLAWVLFSTPIANFFNISDTSQVLLFSPAILIGILLASGKSYLQGSLNFYAVAGLILLEPVAKLISAYILSMVGLSSYVFMAIPISIFVTLFAFFFISKRKSVKVEKGFPAENFPAMFFGASILSGFSTYAFATFDVLLAKHFLSETLAGQYALLSLVGKMVFFFGSILNGFIITYVSREEGLNVKTKGTFNILLVASTFLTISAFVALGPLGYIFVPFLLGDKVTAILPFLTTYTLATSLFTISNVLVVYHLAKKQYLFSIVSLVMSLLMVGGIIVKHEGILEITNIFLLISFVSFVTTALLHFLFEHGKYIVRNFIDLVDLFDPLPQSPKPNPDKKRMLIFNWRDTKHVQAGGAEMYVHEIAKRWVKDGNQVTLFAGNDGMSKRYEIVEGVEVIRRGGFHFVYLWAFLYYFFQFRGKYDVIVDCQNGVPFFTPLYAKEPVYSVVYHVHQKVFSQYLGPIAAFVASSIEKHIMPRAYKHARFITISESTKEEMLELGIKGEGIDIVYCGVDLENLTPGKKTEHPMVLYLGRLKAYKSVDVLIKSFVQVIKKFPNAELVIAGTGDERENLEGLARALGIYHSVTFAGKVTELQKRRLLQKAWVFANPSMQEGWGITTIEANACGTPVIASNVPGLRDSVNNPHTGYLVEYGNVDQFAKKINEVLSKRPLRQKMEKESVKWSGRFTWDVSAKQFGGLL